MCLNTVKTPQRKAFFFHEGAKLFSLKWLYNIKHGILPAMLRHDGAPVGIDHGIWRCSRSRSIPYHSVGVTSTLITIRVRRRRVSSNLNCLSIGKRALHASCRVRFAAFEWRDDLGLQRHCAAPFSGAKAESVSFDLEAPHGQADEATQRLR